MSAFIKKLIIIIAIVVFILFIALLITAWSLGSFARVNVSAGENGPYYFISLDQKSLYPYIPEQIDKIKNELMAKKIPYINPAALIYSDPAVTPLNQVLAQGGLLINDSMAVDSPLVIHHIKVRNVITAEIEANPAIATFKTYPALRDWLQKYNGIRKSPLSYLEIYDKNRVIVEMSIIQVEKD
jgi:hypothetical protein